MLYIPKEIATTYAINIQYSFYIYLFNVLHSFGSFVLPSWICSLQSEKFPLDYLVIQFIGEKFSLLFFWSKFIFISSLFKGTFLVTEFYLEVVVFSVITLKILFHYFLAFLVCVEKLPTLIDI